MHVRQFERALLLCLDSLYPPLSMRKEFIQGLFVKLNLVTRSETNREICSFLIYRARAAANVKVLTARPSLGHIEQLGWIEKCLLQHYALQVSRADIFIITMFLFWKSCFYSFKFKFMSFKAFFLLGEVSYSVCNVFLKKKMQFFIKFLGWDNNEHTQ